VTWQVTRERVGEVHVAPDRDLVEHELTEGCVCIPRIEVVLNEHGPDGHIHVHHSLDGREARE
jgi:hypothetical protein